MADTDAQPARGRHAELPFIGRHRAPEDPKRRVDRRRIAAVTCFALSALLPAANYAWGPGGPRQDRHPKTPVAVVASSSPVESATPTPAVTVTPKTTAGTTTLRGALALAEKQVGVSGRPNKFTRWYATSSYGKHYARKYGVSTKSYLAAEWCSIFLTWVAYNSATVVPGDALASGMAEEFRKGGHWGHKPTVGAFAFFDWSGGRSISGIGHVALVVAVKGDTLTVIEGNNRNRVVRITRSTSRVVGYGHPNYAGRIR